MPTLNVSLPEQLKDWISKQVDDGKYASASDYMRDLIRLDKRQQERQGLSWLNMHLEPLLNTPENEFVSMNAEQVKKLGRQRIKQG